MMNGVADIDIKLLDIEGISLSRWKKFFDVFFLSTPSIILLLLISRIQLYCIKMTSF